MLEIPYHINTSDFSLVQYILNELKTYKIKLVTEEVDWDDFISESSVIQELTKLVHQKNGKLISKSYRGCSSKLEFECQKNHRWFATPRNIQLGSWCHKCNARAISLRNRNSILDVQSLAAKNNSTLISREYRNNLTPLEWECNKHHEWSATLNCMKTRLLKDYWCLYCKNAKKAKQKICDVLTGDQSGNKTRDSKKKFIKTYNS